METWVVFLSVLGMNKLLPLNSIVKVLFSVLMDETILIDVLN